MTSDKVKLARMELTRDLVDKGFKVITHPVLLAVLGYYLSDRLQGDYVDPGTGLQFERLVWDPEKGEYVPDTKMIEKKWDPKAGKLNQGAAIAMQTGLTAYLGSEAFKQIAGALK